jgi:hypothetical protein
VEAELCPFRAGMHYRIRVPWALPRAIELLRLWRDARETWHRNPVLGHPLLIAPSCARCWNKLLHIGTKNGRVLLKFAWCDWLPSKTAVNQPAECFLSPCAREVSLYATCKTQINLKKTSICSKK